MCRRLTALLLVLCLPIAAFSRTMRHRKPRPLPWFNYRAFPPTRNSLIEQNAVIDGMGLPRIKNEKALTVLVQNGDVVPITENKYVRISPRLEASRRYVRPWVDAFLQELGQEYFDRFEEPIQVNSGVRTMRTQMSLLRWNHNAAPVHGEKASAHLAGVAVDLQRRGLTQDRLRFIQQKLRYFVAMKMVIVEEELKQPCIHIVVTGEYPWMPPMKLDFKPSDLLFLQEVPDGNRNFIQPYDCPERSRLDGRPNPATP